MTPEEDFPAPEEPGTSTQPFEDEPDTPAIMTLGEPMSEPTYNTAQSFELGLDIKIDDEWQPVRGATVIDPQFNAKEQDAATYDDKGSDNVTKIGESGTLNLTVQQRRDPETGLFTPEVEELLDAAAPSSLGDAAIREFRYYDKPATGKANPDYAYEFNASVSDSRGATGVAETGLLSFTLTAKGARTRITNPYPPVPAG